MAEVYLVFHIGLRQRFALKLLKTTLARDSRRLLLEGRIQSELDHPNIVQVRDIVDVGTSPALVMSWVAGPSLAELLERGRLTYEQADDIGRQVLTGLGAAHDAGTIHRDLKPANVLLQPQDHRLVAKLTDFGLAKLLGRDLSSVAQTRSGVLLGTPSHMAPEQITAASKVDHRADLFAAGTLLFELVTGVRPFSGDLATVLHHIRVGDRPTVRELAPDAPDRFVGAIDWALELDAADRPATSADLLRMWMGDAPPPETAWPSELLEEIESEVVTRITEISTAPNADPTWEASVTRQAPSRSPLPWILAAAVAVALAAVLWFAIPPGASLHREVAIAEGGYAGIAEADPFKAYRIRAEWESGRVAALWFETHTGAPYPLYQIQFHNPEIDVAVRSPLPQLSHMTLVGLRQEWAGEQIRRVEWVGVSGEAEVIETWEPRDDGTIERTWALPSGEQVLAPATGPNNLPNRKEVIALDDGGRISSSLVEDEIGDPYRGTRWTYDSEGRVVTRMRTDGEGNAEPHRAMIGSRRTFGNGSLRLDFIGLGDAPAMADDRCAAHVITTDGDRRRKECRGLDDALRLDRQGCAIREFTWSAERRTERCLGEDGEPTYTAGGWRERIHILDDRGYVVETRYGPGQRTDGVATTVTERDSRGLVAYRGPDRDASGAVIGADYGLRTTYDLRGRVETLVQVNDAGEPVAGADGSATRQYTYDSRGRLTAVRYFDARSRPVNASGLRHTEVFAYDGGRMPTRTEWRGILDEPVLDPQGVHARSWTWDATGQRTSVSAVDDTGAAVPLSFSGFLGERLWCHRIDTEWEGENWIHTCKDANGEPTPTDRGWAKWSYQTRAGDQFSETHMFDASGAPVDTAYGFARRVREHNNRGRVIRKESYDAGGNPIPGCATEVKEHDAWDNTIAIRCFDAIGNPVPARNGCTTQLREYAPHGVQTRGACLDAEGGPVVTRGGFSEAWSTLDDRGRVMSAHYVLANGEVRRVEHILDGRGRQIRSAAFDDDAPASLPGLPNEAHAIERRFDADDRIVEERLFRADDSPVVDAAHVTHTDFDTRGNVVAISHFDGSDNPFPSQGCATLAYERRSDGKEVSQRCLGADRELFEGRPGWAETRIEYDRRGHVIARSGWRANGTPGVVEGQWYHRVEHTTDSRGRALSDAWTDGAGEPAPRPGGRIARVDRDYSAYGTVEEERYSDGRGNPVPNEEGCTRVRMERLPSGAIASRVCLDE